MKYKIVVLIFFVLLLLISSLSFAQPSGMKTPPGMRHGRGENRCCRASELNSKSSSLQELLKNLVTLLNEEASSQNIHIQVEMNSDLPFVKMDSKKLTQAFINIMKNGMQAMEKGGILRVETQVFKDRVEVSISDSGSGIPEDQMEKIFNYYYTTKEKGVGLGLPIAHRIIEAHAGQLKVESKVGVGTRVTVTLPT